jgi:Histidine phosphatase superfamily (branch 1)
MHPARLLPWLAPLIVAAVLLAPVALAVAQTAPESSATASPALAGPALVTALRRGGYVLYMRHTSTDFGESDERMTDYADCKSQRNLTDTGRAEARNIGAALRELRIPIAEVLASPYCRTLETGRLVFGRATVSHAVRGGPSRPESPDRYAELRTLLSTPVAGRANTAIASHGNPFFGVTGGPYLAEGEIAVIEPQGNGKFRIVARIPKEAWAALVAAAPKVP